jgi:hypothetical protein
MRYWLGLSLALNLLLLSTIVAARVDASRQPAPAASFEERLSRFGRPPVENVAIEQPGDLAEILQLSGLDSRDIKVLVLGWLLVRPNAGPWNSVSQFWQTGYRPGLNALRHRIELERQARDELIDVFGPNATSDPAFDSVFRPLGSEYAFLSSQAQVSLQRRQLELLESGDGVRMQGSNLARCEATSGAPDRGPLSVLPEDWRATEAQEYQLRFSALAQQLRETGAVGDEQEFRFLFERILELASDSSPAAQAEIRADLRTQMGNLAFDQFWSSRDPLFLPVENYLMDQGFTSREALEAYAIVNQSQERLLSAIAQNPSERAMLAAVQQVRNDEATKLTARFGDQVAAGLAAAIARSAMALSQSPVARC